MKLQLSQEEHEQVQKGGTIMNIDNGSPSTFVVEGLELKETQYVVASVAAALAQCRLKPEPELAIT